VVYVDTNIFVYHLWTPTHPQARYCRRFLSQVEQGKLKVVVSTFVISETLAVGLRILSKMLDRGPTRADIEGMIADVKAMLDLFGFQVSDADNLTLDQTGHGGVFDRAAGIVEASEPVRGRIEAGVDWFSVGGADAIHASLAEKLGATHIATCDRAFKGLAAEVEPAILKDVYP
jgi:predicted nucleic acid-binding protein